MFNLSSIFSGIDDLYKFLFVGGVFLVVFSLVYPLEREKELQLAINEYNGEVTKLDRQIEQAIEMHHETSKTLDAYFVSPADSTGKRQPSPKIDSLIAKSERFDRKMLYFKADLQVKGNEIEILQHYVDQYDHYTKGLLYSGIVLTLFGLFGWYRSQRTTNKGRKLDNELKKKELDAP